MPEISPEARQLDENIRRCGVDSVGFRLYFGTGDEAIYGFTCSGKNAVNVWKKLRSSVELTGKWPIMLGVDNDLTFHSQLIEEFVDDDSPTIAAVIEDGEARSAEEFLKAAAADNYYNIADLRGEWPGPQGRRDFEVTTLSKSPNVHIGLIPTHAPWHVPAYLRFGGWNDCPLPSAHVAMFKRWYQSYGAVPTVATHDVIEMYVERPPASKEEALALAEEQFLYCPDIVTQGIETIDALGAVLLNGSQWYFWWD